MVLLPRPFLPPYPAKNLPLRRPALRRLALWRLPLRRLALRGLALRGLALLALLRQWDLSPRLVLTRPFCEFCQIRPALNIPHIR
eukprot:1888650-Alexandrium_andersonii.AAC.1